MFCVSVFFCKFFSKRVRNVFQVKFYQIRVGCDGFSPRKKEKNTCVVLKGFWLLFLHFFFLVYLKHDLCHFNLWQGILGNLVLLFNDWKIIVFILSWKGFHEVPERQPHSFVMFDMITFNYIVMFIFFVCIYYFLLKQVNKNMLWKCLSFFFSSDLICPLTSNS